MKVTLVDPSADPYNNSIATGRTCYSAKGIITPEETAARTELRDDIAAKTFEAGHHTLYQHYNPQFALKGVSRQAIWSFFHNFPYHNSEQQSFRYVTVKPDNFFIPQFKKEYSTDLYTDMCALLQTRYQELIELLTPTVEREFYSRFPARTKKQDKYRGEIKKRCQEVARYLLPVSTTTDLYHTISLLTLVRYYRVRHSAFNAPEVSLIVEEMKRLVCEKTPELERFFQDSGREDYPLAPPLASMTKSVVLRSVSNLDFLNITADTSLFADVLNLHEHIATNKHLDHITITFDKNTSHVCDSQAQRHRTTSRWVSNLEIPSYDRDNSEYVTPTLIKQASQQAQSTYHATLGTATLMVQRLIDSGESVSDSLYLLPGAVKTRVRESTNLSNLIHKHKMRLCLNAQEEFWDSCKQERDQLIQLDTKFADLLQPPCVFRKNVEMTPFCPEKDRYCGVPVWDRDISTIERVI